MLRDLSSSHASGQNMVIHPYGVKHASSVVIVLWQRSEHGFIFPRYKTCSVSCYCLMTTVRKCYYIPRVLNILLQLSSSHDNSQSMVIYPSCMRHAPSVVIV